MPDCMAERGEFEPPVPQAHLWTEFGPSLAHYSARKKAAVLERFCSRGIRLFSDLSGPLRSLG